MTAILDPDLADRLKEMGHDPVDDVKVSDVASIVTSILQTMRGDITSLDIKLFEELKELSGIIEEAKSDIAALRPDEVRDEFIPKASDELDAIVEATAEATNNIMDAVETVESVMNELEGDPQNQLMDATTQIYEACGFQDITGQRITKVVTTLKNIEDRVDALVAAFGDEIERYKAENPVEAPEVAEETPPTDEDLLHGPQMKSDAISQAEIDALLASFD